MLLIGADGVKDEAGAFEEAGGWSDDRGWCFITGMDEGGGNVTKVIFIPSWWSSVYLSVTLHLYSSLYPSGIVFFDVSNIPTTLRFVSVLTHVSGQAWKSVLIWWKRVSKAVLPGLSLRFLPVSGLLHNHRSQMSSSTAAEVSPTWRNSIVPSK